MIPNGIDCSPNPNFGNEIFGQTRFKIRAHHGYEPDEERGWTHKLEVVDLKYLDHDGLPIYSIAHGDSWPEAFLCAFEYIRTALATPGECVFI